MLSARPRQSFRLTLKPVLGRDLEGMRCPTAADPEQLAALMYHAYLGTIDYEGEDEAEALAEVRRTFAGAYGSFLWSASQVVERPGCLASAALVTRWQGSPIVAFLMTRPEFKRQGFARACLAGVVNHLLLEGESELRLVSTVGNVSAIDLYEKVGFVIQQDA